MSLERGYNTVLNKGKHVKSINFFNAQFVWNFSVLIRIMNLHGGTWQISTGLPF